MRVHLGSRSNQDTLKAIIQKELCIVYGRTETDCEGRDTIYLTVKPRKEGKECE